MTDIDLYGWPVLLTDPDDETEVEWATWAYAARNELDPIYTIMYQPIPDNPVELDDLISEWVDGWLPRAQFFAVKAEYYLARAKGERYPSGLKDPDTGKPVTAGERDAVYEGRLAGFRFVRDEFEGLVRRMVDRVRWAQSVRKGHGEAQ